MDIYARPQNLVRINRRRRLNLMVMGQGGPTVVLAAGFLGGPLDWGLVQPFVARTNRVVSFDPAGLGFSDPGPLPRTSTAIVQDLRAALRAADLPPPYVLVGHSAGGLRMRLFAAQHPEEVVGLVMVDSVLGDWQTRCFGGPAPGMVEEHVVLKRLLALARAGSLTPDRPEYVERIGLPRPMLSPAVNEALHRMWTSPSYLRAAISENAHIRAANPSEAAADQRSLGDLPLVVLTAATLPGFVAAPQAASRWLEMHEEMAALSTRGVRRTVEGGHNLPVENPRAVTAAIAEVLAAA